VELVANAIATGTVLCPFADGLCGIGQRRAARCSPLLANETVEHARTHSCGSPAFVEVQQSQGSRGSSSRPVALLADATPEAS
jgi:hypothetical protein